MKKFALVAVVVSAVFSLFMFGCAKKDSGVDEYQEAMSLDTLGGPSAPAQAQNTKVVDTKAASLMQASAAGAPAKLEALPPSGPYKPSIHDIQTALKNAGYYAGEVDGKTGKMTKQAIEDFQKANNLEADGKVGPKTWAILSTHLNSPAAAPVGKKR